MSVLDVLSERGFIEQTTHQEDLAAHLAGGPATCYIGFDPTAPSLHIGSLVPIMSLAHMQRHGHRPIALVGGGTGLVGDPSGKTEMRRILTAGQVDANAQALKGQLSRFIDFSADRALLVNNAEWLTRLEYIPFLRDIGRHFSVNRMLKAESYRMRLDSDEGLNFIEFNYMLLQAYDFAELYRRHDCRLQMGGSDQWGNIVAGIDLVRKLHREAAFGITFPLISTAGGAKMGKTAKGAVWLDAARTSPYDYFQYWINCADADVQRFLALYTFLPMEEIRVLADVDDTAINAAKTILAYETTRIVHGESEALGALQAAASMFGGRAIAATILPSSDVPRQAAARRDGAVPQSSLPAVQIDGGLPVFKLFQLTGLAATGGAARRLIRQGGAYLNNERLRDEERPVGAADFIDGALVLRAGKKRYHKVVLEV